MFFVSGIMQMNKKIIIFAFYFSLLLPGYCLSNAKCFYQQLKNTYPDTIFEGWELGFQGKALNKKEQERMEQLCEGDIAYQFRFEEILPEVSMEEDIAVLGYGGEMQTFAGNSMVSGRFLKDQELKNDEKKCVVSDKLAAMENLQIRDRIKIHEAEFVIIGIMNGYGKNKVVVPYDCFTDIYSHHSMQQSVMVERDSDISLVKNQLAAFGIDSSQIFLQSLEESGREGKVFLKDMILSRAGVGIAVSAFSLLNIFVILLGMMQQKKEEYAIKRAVGATKSDLLKEFVKETISAMSLAIVMFLVSFRAVIQILNLEQEVIFDLSTIIGVIGIAFLFCLCLSVLLVNHFMKISIYELLQKERG